MSESLESLLCCTGGETEAQKYASACQTPPATMAKVTEVPDPQEAEVPAFLWGEFHLSVSETAPALSPSPWWTMALCTSFPPSHSPLHT